MIVLYTKPNCELCDHLKDALRQRRVPFDERNIASRIDLFEAYKLRVPVIVGPDGTEYDPPFPEERVESLARLFG